METADLVVINTCAIREGAEQKVIGRQGQLARLKAANPALRVVLTGCSVREPDRAGLRRRYPAVDLFLRPDEEPELVDRLGLASAQAPIGASRRDDHGRAHGRRRRGPPGRRPVRRAVGEGTVARGSAISAWLPIIYGCDKTCTYCIVPFSRGPERSRPFDDIVDEARRWPRPATARSRCSARTSTRTATTCRRSRGSRTSTRTRWAGRRLDLARAAGPRRAHPRDRRLRTADGRRAIGGCASSRRTRGTSRTG